MTPSKSDATALDGHRVKIADIALTVEYQNVLADIIHRQIAEHCVGSALCCWLMVRSKARSRSSIAVVNIGRNIHVTLSCLQNSKSGHQQPSVMHWDR